MIRTAKPTDLPALMALYNHLRGGLAYTQHKAIPPTPAHIKALAALLKQKQHQVLVSVVKGKVVGTCTLYILPRVYWSGKPWGILDSIVVAEDRQGQGAGSQLIRHALKQAKRAGCGQVNLTSNTQRVRAHRFYESLGFEATYVGFKFVF